MIRITGGQYRGRQIYCPKGKTVRPTTAFVRESLFSILSGRLSKVRVLDLFAGSGIVGFEALSRGAAFVTAVEQSATQGRMIEKNLDLLNIPEYEYQLIVQDAMTWVKQLPPETLETEQYDLIYLDPPYVMGEKAVPLIELLLQKQVLHPAGVLVWESDLKTFPEVAGAQLNDTRRYGESSLGFFSYRVL